MAAAKITLASTAVRSPKIQNRISGALAGTFPLFMYPPSRRRKS
jgi:hypothetical protein